MAKDTADKTDAKDGDAVEGEDGGELRPALEAEARTLGLAERVHFTGWWEDVGIDWHLGATRMGGID